MPMRSPGFHWLRGTLGNMLYCWCAECGMLTPTAAQAASVRPEQSKLLGPSAPNTYGSPACLFAYAAAWPPRLWSNGGTGPVDPRELERLARGLSCALSAFHLARSLLRTALRSASA